MEKNDQPLVSFVVNCYNGASYLKRCFDSILAQEYDNWELIFFDNASTDESREIFLGYHDLRFFLHQSQVNLSLGQARALAVDQCHGKYIAFLDVDDLWFPEKTKVQVEAMESTNAVLSYGSVVIRVEETGREYIAHTNYKTGDLFESNLMQFEINMPTSMLLRECLTRKGLNFDANIFASEEYCLFMQMIIGEVVAVIPQPLATYYIRTNSLTAQKLDRLSFERRYTLDRILAANPGIRDRYPAAFDEAYARADYYEARYLVTRKEQGKARKLMVKHMFRNYRYFVLAMLLFLPQGAWNRVHAQKNKRNGQ